ncbi:MAG: hypothetical protein ACLR56_00385 [Oscillospiraceae bacterium]
MENKMRRNIQSRQRYSLRGGDNTHRYSLAAENRDYEPPPVLRHTEIVALYNDGKISDVFGEISLNELPEEDVRILRNGIAFRPETRLCRQ